jgi:hypothetical protein
LFLFVFKHQVIKMFRGGQVFCSTWALNRDEGYASLHGPFTQENGPKYLGDTSLDGPQSRYGRCGKGRNLCFCHDSNFDSPARSTVSTDVVRHLTSLQMATRVSFQGDKLAKTWSWTIRLAAGSSMLGALSLIHIYLHDVVLIWRQERQLCSNFNFHIYGPTILNHFLMKMWTRCKTVCSELFSPWTTKIIFVFNNKFWEEIIAHFPLILHGPHRERRIQQFSNYYVCKSLTYPLLSNGGTHIGTQTEERYLWSTPSYIGSGAITRIPSFIKIGSGIQRLMGRFTGTQTTQTEWWSHKPALFLSE